jgi:predicted DNA-binding transcriptional regulator AlpA
MRREAQRWEHVVEGHHTLINYKRLFLETSDMPRKADGADETPASNIRPLLRLKEVLKLVRLHRSTVERLIASGKFPEPRRPTGAGGIRFWDEDEVVAWREAYDPTGPRARPWERK